MCWTSLIPSSSYLPCTGRNPAQVNRKIRQCVRTLATLGAASPLINPTLVQDTAPDPKPNPVPLQYLYQTASPYVYVAACAMDTLQMDPKTLFTECSSSLHKNTKAYPPSFRSSHFDYISPKSFGHQLPTYDQPNSSSPIPEIAILGKSNVGKSSLINSLTRKKDLAKISKTPGRTQQINYFGFFPKDSIPEESSISLSSSTTKKGAGSIPLSHAIAFLIDLPGYGYAEAPVERVIQWQDTTQDFLQHRRDIGVLKRLYILVDSRHGLSSIDRAVIGWLDDAEIPYCIVLTKADRIGRPMLVRYANDICMRYHSQTFNQGYVSESMDSTSEDGMVGRIQASHGLQSPLVHVTSSKTGEGIHELMWTMHWDLFDTSSLSTL